MDSLKLFRDAFGRLTGNRPFPWQEDLYTRYFTQGLFPHSCSLPTGLGKTSVVAVWLIALANNPNRIPRRLVYVVNRRTVVDQTTNEVETLRANLQPAGLLNPLRDLCALPLRNGEAPLALSTLRGQFADNREWSADPCRPAVVVGTVDMIGSRLLFSGYGVGLKTKPLQAGFLAQDVLLVHDEAHLEPAFQALIETIRDEQTKEPAPLGQQIRLQVMALSATSRRVSDNCGLTQEEQAPPPDLPDPPTEPIHVAWQRLAARKWLRFHTPKNDKEKVAERIAELAKEYSNSHAGSAVLVFVNSLEDHATVCKGLKGQEVQVLTGTLRGLERDRMANPRSEAGCPIFARFLKPPKPGDVKGQWKAAPRPGTVYLVCTAAGEVGIDISADHMVCDLTSFERMTQRLGRVNRFGAGEANIDIVHEARGDKKKENEPNEQARWKTLDLLKELPQTGERWLASPLALLQLRERDDLRARFEPAYTPPPAILPATDILFDAWALTTISPPLVRERLPGRPPVEPYLHGISNWQPPETHVAWRKEVEVITGGLLDRYKPEELLEDFPLKPHELLRDRSDRVYDELQAIRERSERKGQETAVWLEGERGQIEVTALGELLNADKRAATRRIAYCHVLLPPSAGGLSERGTLDGKLDFDPDHPTGYDIADKWGVEGIQGGQEFELPRRWRGWDDERPPRDAIIAQPRHETWRRGKRIGRAYKPTTLAVVHPAICCRG